MKKVSAISAIQGASIKFQGLIQKQTCNQCNQILGTLVSKLVALRLYNERLQSISNPFQSKHLGAIPIMILILIYELIQQFYVFDQNEYILVKLQLQPDTQIAQRPKSNRTIPQKLQFQQNGHSNVEFYFITFHLKAFCKIQCVSSIIHLHSKL